MDIRSLAICKARTTGLGTSIVKTTTATSRKLTSGTLDCSWFFFILWRTWQEMNEECWLGSISTMVAAFLAAVHGFHGFWPPEASSTSRKPLLLALRRYLAKSLGQFQVPTLQVLLSGWPIFQLLRRFPLRRFPGPTPESRELHRRAGRMSKTIGRCWAQEAWPNRWSCSCEAMRPVAKAAAG